MMKAVRTKLTLPNDKYNGTTLLLSLLHGFLLLGGWSLRVSVLTGVSLHHQCLSLVSHWLGFHACSNTIFSLKITPVLHPFLRFSQWTLDHSWVHVLTSTSAEKPLMNSLLCTAEVPGQGYQGILWWPIWSLVSVTYLSLSHIIGLI